MKQISRKTELKLVIDKYLVNITKYQRKIREEEAMMQIYISELLACEKSETNLKTATA